MVAASQHTDDSDIVSSAPTRVRIGFPHIGIWLGVLVTAGGASLLALAWGRTAGTTNVALQVPYVISAGFTGLGLIAVGLLTVSISVKQAETRDRIRQLGELRALLAELGDALADQR